MTHTDTLKFHSSSSSTIDTRCGDIKAQDELNKEDLECCCWRYVGCWSCCDRVRSFFVSRCLQIGWDEEPPSSVFFHILLWQLLLQPHRKKLGAGNTMTHLGHQWNDARNGKIKKNWFSGNVNMCEWIDGERESWCVIGERGSPEVMLW